MNRKKRIIIIIAVCASVAFLLIAFAAALCLKLAVFGFPNYSAARYDRGVEDNPIMPTTSDVGNAAGVYTKYNFKWMLIFETRAYTLIAEYGEDDYEAEKRSVLEKYEFQTETITDSYSGTVHEPSFDLDGFRFSLLSLSSERYQKFEFHCRPWYPKELYFIGYNDESRKIAYVWFDDVDLDEIRDPFPNFLRTECGW